MAQRLPFMCDGTACHVPHVNQYDACSQPGLRRLAARAPIKPRPTLLRINLAALPPCPAAHSVAAAGQIHETLPQTLLPLMPLLREELEAEAEGAKRSAAVDLVARLFTQHPSGAAIIEEYPALLEGLLGRVCDKEVRRMSGAAVMMGKGREAPGPGGMQG